MNQRSTEIYILLYLFLRVVQVNCKKGLFFNMQKEKGFFSSLSLDYEINQIL
jgi:hypothetical protein